MKNIKDSNGENDGKMCVLMSFIIKVNIEKTTFITLINSNMALYFGTKSFKKNCFILWDRGNSNYLSEFVDKKN